MQRHPNVLLFIVAGSTLAMFAFCGLCGIALLIPSWRQQAATRTVAAIRPTADATTQQARKNLIDDLIAAGLVTAIDANRSVPTVTVNKAAWDGLKFEQKQVFADLWYAYCHQLPQGSRGEFMNQLRIRDSLNHKDLATFSASGLKIE